jgi:hypothetical protein
MQDQGYEYQDQANGDGQQGVEDMESMARNAFGSQTA